MTELLLEDFKNLNMIDHSFFKSISGNKRIDLGNNVTISPDSEIIVDKVRDPHTFQHAIEILNDKTVGGIVVRASRRQVMFIGKRDIATALEKDSKYVVIISDYIYDTYDNISSKMTQILYISNDESLFQTISKILLYIYDKAGPDVKKLWDIIVVKYDSKDSLRDERTKSKENMVYVPKDENYNEFIDNLNNLWKEKSIDYLDSKRENIKSIADANRVLLKIPSLRRIKVLDTIFVFNRVIVGDVYYGGEELEFSVAKGLLATRPYWAKCKLVISIVFKGLQASVNDVKIKDWDGDYYSLETFYEMVTDEIKEEG